MVNSALISGGRTDKDRQAVKDALQQNAEDSMRHAASDAQLTVSKPLTKASLSAGWLFAEMHCKTNDGSAWFSGFSVAGPATLVLVTVEGNTGTEGSVDIVSKAVKGITWAQIGPPEKRKPFWKFW